MHPSSLFQVQFYLQLFIQMYNIKSIFVVTKLTAHYNTKRSVSWIVISGHQQILIFSLPGQSVIREGTFFLGGKGEGWGILVFFSQKSVGPPLRFNKKTPDPPPLGDWQKRDPPLTTTWYVPCCRNLRTFRLWTQSVWIWIYLDIECVRAETRKMRTISVGYLRFIAEVWIWKYLSIIKVLNIKYLRENTRASFSD